MTLWSLLAGVLIIGTASVIVLGHDYKHRSILPPSEAQQANSAAPSIVEFQNIKSASMPQSTEIAATPAQEPDAPKPAVAKPKKAKQKKAKQKSANKRRYAQRQNYQHVRYNFGPTAPSIMGAPGAY